MDGKTTIKIEKFPLYLCLFEIAIYLSNDMYLPALPQIMRDLHTSVYTAQLTLISWLLGASSPQLVLGPISDRYGRRPVILIACVTFILSSLTCALAPNATTLLLARFFQGCTVCAISVAGYAAIHELYESKQAIGMISFMGSITVLAPAFGPLIGGFVLEAGNWRWIFFILTLWGGCSFISLIITMPETNILGKGSSFNLQRLIKSYKNTLKNKIFMENTLLHCFISVGVVSWITMSSLLIIDSFHHSPLFYGLTQAFVFVGYTLGCRYVQRKISVVDKTKFIHYGLVVVTLSSLCAFFIAVLSPHFLWGFILCVTLYTTGGALMFGALNRSAIDACTEPMGARLSIFSSVISLAIVGGVTLASVLYDGTILSISFVLITVSLFACLFKLHRLHLTMAQADAQNTSCHSDPPSIPK